MQPSNENYTERVERDRKRHELAMLLFLLSKFKTAGIHAISAVRIGNDAASAAVDVILGNASIGQSGIAQGIVRRMLDAFVSGWRRAGLAAAIPLTDPYYRAIAEAMPVAIPVGFPALPFIDSGSQRTTSPATVPPIITPPPIMPTIPALPGPDMPTVIERFKAFATDVANRIAAKVRNGIRAATSGVQSVGEAIGKVRSFFRKSGLVKSQSEEATSPFVAEGIATEAVIQAHNDGTGAGFLNKAAVQLKGFLFDATIDARTTIICRTCNGTKVEVDSPWLLTHTPKLHWNCRSVLKPLFHDFTPTLNPPAIAPMFGFGSPGGSLQP